MINKEILKTLTVLYVEDEKDIKEFTSRVLENLTKKVFSASDGIEGLDLFIENKNEIDLIITDINMPKLNGLDMCDKIREINKKTPIIVTSAHTNENFIQHSINIDVKEYCSKPIDLYHLIDSMVRAVEPTFLQKKLDILENNLQDEIPQLKSILDAQDNIAVLTEEQIIIEANKSFLDFFKFSELKRLNIFDLFDQEFGYITKENIDTSNWFNYINNLPEVDKVVKIKSIKNENKIFSININNYKNCNKYFIVTLTDITKVKEKTTLLEYQINHDRITGLYNKEKFKEIFEKEFKRDRRYNNNLSVIKFDIDDFDSIENSFGEVTTNKILNELATLVKLNIREQDISARWGKEEFLILLPETDINGAYNVAIKIKDVTQKTLFTSMDIKITSCFGISSLLESDSREEMIIRATKALNEIKRDSKNEIKVWEE